MPKAIKKRVVKRAEKEEEVKHLVHRVKEKAVEKQKSLLPILIVGALVVIAITGFLVYRSTSARKAAALEYEAYQTYYGLYQKQPLQKAEQIQKALDGFKKAYETRKSALALFYIGSSSSDLGKHDDSLNAFKELIDRFPNDEQYLPLAYHKMAMIQIKKGDTDGALKTLDAIASLKTGALKDLALAESARILESLGKKEEAAKKREEMKKNFPNSPFLGQQPPQEVQKQEAEKKEKP